MEDGGNGNGLKVLEHRGKAFKAFGATVVSSGLFLNQRKCARSAVVLGDFFGRPLRIIGVSEDHKGAFCEDTIVLVERKDGCGRVSVKIQCLREHNDVLTALNSQQL